MNTLLTNHQNLSNLELIEEALRNGTDLERRLAQIAFGNHEHVDKVLEAFEDAIEDIDNRRREIDLAHDRLIDDIDEGSNHLGLAIKSLSAEIEVLEDAISDANREIERLKEDR